MSAVAYGLIAMFGIGTLNVLIKILTKKNDDFKIGFLIQVLGFLIVLLLFPFLPKASLENIQILLLLVAGVFGSLAFIFINKSFSKGPASINSPLISTWSVITSLFGFLLLGEEVFLLKILGIVLVVVGIFVTSIDFATIRKNKNLLVVPGALEALIAAGLLSISMFILAYLTTFENWFTVNFVYRTFVLITYLILAIKRDTKLVSNFRSIPRLILAAGALDVISMMAINLGYSKGEPSIISVLTSANTIVTVSFAFFFLKEKITIKQLIGIIIVISGILILAIT